MHPTQSPERSHFPHFTQSPLCFLPITTLVRNAEAWSPWACNWDVAGRKEGLSTLLPSCQVTSLPLSGHSEQSIWGPCSPSLWTLPLATPPWYPSTSHQSPGMLDTSFRRGYWSPAPHSAPFVGFPGKQFYKNGLGENCREPNKGFHFVCPCPYISIACSLVLSGSHFNLVRFVFLFNGMSVWNYCFCDLELQPKNKIWGGHSLEIWKRRGWLWLLATLQAAKWRLCIIPGICLATSLFLKHFHIRLPCKMLMLLGRTYVSLWVDFKSFKLILRLISKTSFIWEM